MSALAIDPAVRSTVCGALALLFGWAAIHKLRDVAAFRAAVTTYELLPPRAVNTFVAMLMLAEIAVAVALLIPAWAASAGLAAAGLLALYTVAIVINLMRGRRDIDCGCTGVAARRPLSAGLMLRNIVLIAAALVSVLPVTLRPLLWVDGVTIAAGVAALVLLYAAIDGLLANAPAIAALIVNAHGRQASLLAQVPLLTKEGSGEVYMPAMRPPPGPLLGKEGGASEVWHA